MSNFKLTVIITVSLLVGGLFGWYMSQYSSLINDHNYNARQDKFQSELEGFEPKCEDLKSVGIKGPYPIGQGYAFVQVESTYFHVIGFISEPGAPFTTGWWGADRQGLMDQTCKEAKP
jgi:hypothetical protein